MENYVEHNDSNTISVKPNEWDGVVQWIYNNWDTGRRHSVVCFGRFFDGRNGRVWL